MQAIKVNIRKMLDMTLGDVNRILGELQSSDLYYCGNFIEIGKAFLHKAIGKGNNIHELSFEEARKVYQEESGEEDLPTDEYGFYKEICSFYLQLEYEPRYKLVEFLRIAQGHIREIDERLQQIEKEIKAIKESNKRIIEGIDQVDLLEYYQKKNLQAKEEIIEFLSTRILDEARVKSHKFRALWGLFPYLYGFDSDWYEVNQPLPFANTLLDVPVSQFAEIKRLYKEDKPGFLSWLTEQIENEGYIHSLQEKIGSHHVLAERANTLNHLLNLYCKKEWFAFSNLTLLQIEGLLTDLCLMFELDKNRRTQLENKMAQSGLGFKLDLLRDTMAYELDYEYFQFRFRVLRNRVAHGRLTETEIEITASILLVDLYKVCECTRSLDVPMNRRINLAGIIKEELGKGEVGRSFIVQYFLLDHIPIPDFYGHGDLEGLLKPVFTDAFWKHFEDSWELYQDENQAAFKAFLKKVGKRFSELKGKVNELDKKLVCRNKEATYEPRDIIRFDMGW